jgi:CBS domain-containing protein
MLRELCTKPVVTIGPDAPVRDAARLMRDKNVGAVVVVNTGKPLGIITDRDITVAVVAADDDPGTVTVRDVMHRDPTVIHEDKGLFDAVKTFASSGVRRLPVVGKTGKVTGIIALDDVLMLLGNEMAHVSSALSNGLRHGPAAAAV